jgi:predicted transcriptional regulator
MDESRDASFVRGKEGMVKLFFCLLGGLSLMAMAGCAPQRAAVAKARLVVESTSTEGLSPSSTESAVKAQEQMVSARVISRAHDTRLQAEVAESLGVTPQMVSNVIVEGVGDTRFVEVRAEIEDPELAAKLVNAVAQKLAEAFRNDPEVRVRVVDTAAPPQPTK